jgi:hypothetical protein
VMSVTEQLPDSWGERCSDTPVTRGDIASGRDLSYYMTGGRANV